MIESRILQNSVTWAHSGRKNDGWYNYKCKSYLLAQPYVRAEEPENSMDHK